MRSVAFVSVAGMAWTAETTWNDINLQEGEWQSSPRLETHCYRIGVEAKSGADHSADAQLTAFRIVAEQTESGQGYSLLVDYNITLFDRYNLYASYFQRIRRNY